MDALVSADLDDPLDEQPEFPVEPPRRDYRVAEITAAVIFRRLLRRFGPACTVFANANAGKRNPRQAMREGIVAGCFDYTVTWPRGGIAWVELKGHTARGRPGRLSDAQIRWGNRMQRQGQMVGCFYDPLSAIAWLRVVGAPIEADWP